MDMRHSAAVPPSDVMLQINIPISVAETVLRGLGKLPLEEAIVAFEAVRSQAQAAIAGFEAARRPVAAAPAKPHRRK